MWFKVNLAKAPAMSQKIIARPGTTLFHVAAQYLGDATQWTRIASINDIQDPFLTDIATLIIPSLSAAKNRGFGA